MHQRGVRWNVFRNQAFGTTLLTDCNGTLPASWCNAHKLEICQDSSLLTLFSESVQIAWQCSMKPAIYLFDFYICQLVFLHFMIDSTICRYRSFVLATSQSDTPSFSNFSLSQSDGVSHGCTSPEPQIAKITILISCRTNVIQNIIRHSVSRPCSKWEEQNGDADCRQPLSHIIWKQYSLTFGVATPTMYGTIMPVIELTVLPMPIKTPANCGLRSSELIATPGTPWNATDMAKCTTTHSLSHSAYDAATMKMPVNIDAVDPFRFAVS